MAVDLNKLVNSRFGLGLVLALGRLVPEKLGYSLAENIADWIAARQGLAIVRAVRANQWVVHGTELTPAQLDQAVRETFRHHAHSLYDLFHHLHEPSAVSELIDFTPQAKAVLKPGLEPKQGLVIVGVHTSNFDFVIQAAAMNGLDALTIALPDPSPAVRRQNEIRRQAGLDIIPASMAAMRQALRHLQAGGFVMTGIDRPIPDPKYCPRFFGRPAALSVFHVMIALRAQVPVVVGAALMQPNGIYRIHVSDPIEMQPHSNREKEILQNAEAVLEVAARFIRQAPHQWAMFLPVWPDALEEVP